MNPTKEQFEAAAKFMGIELIRIAEGDRGNLLCRVRHPDCDFVEGWIPHMPSKDAYNMLVKVMQFIATAHNRCIVSNLPKTVHDAVLDRYLVFEKQARPDIYAEYFFNLAVSLGESMS